ncbi:thioesterase family protein [Nocardiopsis mangrovi]|uniref:Thioesterase family protein n=1 Tax=Nocardiopsis mangrovi TaxID=1179818 RepID=A0ABV9E254_9ACTN
MDTGSYYEPVGENRYVPTSHAGGAWDPDEQHFSPLGGLIAHAIDRYLAGRPDDGRMLSRISYDILGRPTLAECEIRVATIRPGRTIELVEAVVLIAERPVVRARAWLLGPFDTTAVAGGAPEALTPPDELAPVALTPVWPGGYIASLDIRPVSAPRPGRATAWLSSRVGLVAGEDAGPLASFIALVDTANGVAARQPPTAWMFPNVDLTIHLHRRPEGRWVGLDTSVTFGPTGQGITSTVLHDVAGAVGHAQQILTVRPLPAAE